MSTLSSDEFTFKMVSFKSFSIQFLIVLIITFATSAFGFLFALMVPIMFFMSPYLWYIVFAWIPRRIIDLGNSRFGKLLDFIPFLKFSGTWLLESKSEKLDLNSWKDFRGFLKDYFSQYALINIGIFYLFYRFRAITNLETGLNLDVFSNLPLFVLLQNVMGLIFIVSKTLEDVELKILKSDEQQNVHGLIDAAYGFKSLLVVYLGISIISQGSVEYGQDFSPFLSDMLSLILFTVGVPFFLCFIYYKSNFHSYVVNGIRKYLVENREEFGLVVGRVEFDELYCNACGTLNDYPNYFCTSCGNDTSKMKSPIFEQPVTIGTMKYKDQNNLIDDKFTIRLEETHNSPWKRSHKILFGLTSIIPALIFVLIILNLFAQ